MSPPKSKLWKHFQKKDSKTATCKICLREVKFSGNTSNLLKHLKSNHKSVSVNQDDEPASKSDKQSLLQGKPTGSVLVNRPLTSLASTSHSSLDYNDPLAIEVCPVNVEADKAALVSPITEAFNKARAFAVGGIRYSKTVNSILYFICKDNRPFAVVEGEGFKHLMHELAPAFKIPSVDFLKKQLINKYEAVSSRLKTKLNKATHICLSTDVWTETMAEKSYLGVTAHFLDGISIISIDLACKQLDSNHTAEYLGENLTKILADWEIEKEKVISIVTDNGSNIVAAAQIALPNKQMPCFAHTLNLVTMAAVSHPDVVGIIAKVRSVVKYIKNSVINSDKLRKIQIESNVPEGKVKKMILDVKTRWNSTYYMVERFLELLSVVSQIVINDNTSPEMPTAVEISDLRDLASLLKPFEFATTDISGEKYITVSKIIPMINCLISQLGKFNATSTSMKAVKQTLETEMAKRFGKAEQNYRLAISTLLDPRFKNIHFQNASACGSAISKLKAVCKEESSQSSVSGDSSEEEKTNPAFDFWQTHKELAQGKNKKGKQADSSEITLYLSNPVTPLKSHPLEAWEDMKNVFPALYKQARKNLLHMATSVPSERLFSKAGSTVNQLRNRLSAKFLDKLVFLNSVSDEEWFL